MWTINPHESYPSKRRWCLRKHPGILMALEHNLVRYEQALNACGDPQRVRPKYVQRRQGQWVSNTSL